MSHLSVLSTSSGYRNMKAWNRSRNGLTVVIKPSEITLLPTFGLCDCLKEAEFPPGVVNAVNGYEPVAGKAISGHMDINGSVHQQSCNREAHAWSCRDSDMKSDALELGQDIIFDLDQAVNWADTVIYSYAGRGTV